MKEITPKPKTIKRRWKWLILLVVLLTYWNRPYLGDGVYHKQGSWPIAHQNVVMPEFQLAEGVKKTYSLLGYRRYGRSWFDVNLVHDQWICFNDLDFKIRVIVSSSARKLYMYEGPISEFAKFVRSHNVRLKISAHESELDEIELRQLKQKGTNHLWTTDIPSSLLPLKISLEILYVPEQLEGATVHVELSSGGI